MHFGTAFTFVLAALIAASILPPPSGATPLMDDELDRPNTDYTALFRAYLDMGNAIFGTWAPEGVMEEFIRNRETLDD
ncbi:hypothetical protein KR009_005042 [Drosophila setifemur]|nr:hypothetical protein KR009_005042 [Drosophila setifemur]